MVVTLHRSFWMGLNGRMRLNIVLLEHYALSFVKYSPYLTNSRCSNWAFGQQLLADNALVIPSKTQQSLPGHDSWFGHRMDRFTLLWLWSFVTSHYLLLKWFDFLLGIFKTIRAGPPKHWASFWKRLYDSLHASLLLSFPIFCQHFRWSVYQCIAHLVEITGTKSTKPKLLRIGTICSIRRITRLVFVVVFIETKLQLMANFFPIDSIKHNNDKEL